MTAPATVYPAKYYPIYKAWQTPDGWIVVHLEDRHHMRNVDGGKVHKSRQNAYAKAKRLNKQFEHARRVLEEGQE